MSKVTDSTLMTILTSTMVSLVRRDEADLTARQLAVLLVCEANAEPQTVRGLAATLNVAKPVITRAVDKLEDLRLLERRPDLSDRRSVLIRTTKTGRNHVRSISSVMAKASKAVAADEAKKLAA